MPWKPLLDFPWDYPEHFTVAIVDPETGEVSCEVVHHGGHGWLYRYKYGPQDTRSGLPMDIENDEGWRAFAWTDAPPFPPWPLPPKEA